MSTTEKEDGRDATYFWGDVKVLYTAPDGRFKPPPRFDFAVVEMEQLETKKPGTWKEFSDEEWAEWERQGGMSKAAWQAANELKQKQRQRDMGERRSQKELQHQRDQGRAPY